MLSDKATELGRLIGQSAEYQAVKRANEALNGEGEITGALQRMDAVRTESQQKIERGEQPTAEMEQDLDTLLSTVNAGDASTTSDAVGVSVAPRAVIVQVPGVRLP